MAPAWSKQPSRDTPVGGAGTSAAPPTDPGPAQAARPSSPQGSPPLPAPEAPATARPRALRVALLKSRASYAATTALAAWEADGCELFLRSLGCEVEVLHDGELDAAHLAASDLLVLPNSRCISVTGSAAVAAWVAQGGRLLATEMSSYRDEGNHRVGQGNGFQLAAELGADFKRWTSGWPRCEHLQLEPDLGMEVARLLGEPTPVDKIGLGRNTAMLVAARPGATVLARWLDADGQSQTTDAGADGSALLTTHEGRVIYCGENLLSPELLRSPQVEALVLALLRRATRTLAGSALPDQLPGSARAALEQQPLPSPNLPPLQPDASSQLVRVLLKDGVEHLHVLAGRYRLTRGTAPATSPGHAPTAPSQAPAGVAAPSTSQASSEDVVDCPLDLTVSQPASGEAQVACSTVGASWSAGALTVAPLDGTSPIYCYDQRPNGTGRLQAYRGSLQLVVGTQGLRAINQVHLDAYTAGVVPNEVPASNPTEALRAMAVVARTFASQRRGWHRGFDLCNTVHCQVYGGYLSEATSTTQAVVDTAGEMLRNPGAGPQGSDGTVDATFHAVCGGVGEAVERVWPQGAVGYLRGGPDAPSELPDLSDEAAFRQLIDHPPAAWCEASPRFRWTERYTLPQLQALFEESLPRTVGKAYQGLGTLRAVQVASRSPRGRVQALRIEGSIGSYLVEKDSIRWLWSRGILGQGGLQSTLFYLDTPEPGVIVIHGGGWGHGVGMCQDGAAGLARHGHAHASILEHYYPGTILRGAKVDPTQPHSPLDQAPGPPPSGSPPSGDPGARPLEAPAPHSSPR